MTHTLRSSAKVSVAVLASRVLGVARDALFGGVFGVSWITDAYFVAFRIPNLLRDLFAEGALSSAFMPSFAEALVKEGQARAYQLANLVLTGTLLVTSALALLGIVFAEPIAAFWWSGAHDLSAGLEMATLLQRLMMPILVLISLSAVFMGMLNAQRRFTVPAFAPALFNLTSISAGLGLWLVGARGANGIIVWSAATTAAATVQAFCQLPALRRLGFRWRLQWRGLRSDPSVRRIVRLMAPAAIGLAAVQLNVLINTHFAVRLGEGAVSLLSYAFRLFYLPVGVFGVALAVVTTSRVADGAARGNRVAVREHTREGARAAWMLATASTVGLLVLAEPILIVLFERGMWSPGDTAAAVPIVRAYVLGVIPTILVKIYVPAFYSLDRPRIPLLGSLAAVAVNLAFVGVSHRSLGVPGLALGSTLAALVNYAVLRIGFARLMTPPDGAQGEPGQAAETVSWAGEGWQRPVLALVVSNLVMALTAWAGWRAGSFILGGPGQRLVGVVAGLWLALTIAVSFVAYALLLRSWRYPGGEELLIFPLRLFDRFREQKTASARDRKGGDRDNGGAR